MPVDGTVCPCEEISVVRPVRVIGDWRQVVCPNESGCCTAYGADCRFLSSPLRWGEERRGGEWRHELVVFFDAHPRFIPPP